MQNAFAKRILDKPQMPESAMQKIKKEINVIGSVTWHLLTL